MRKIYLLLFIIFIPSCGFESIYSSKNFLFEIGKINFEENDRNRQIVRSLRSISNKDAQKILDIDLNSNLEKRVVSKTKTGDPETFELAILVTIKVLNREKIFVSKQNYSNNDNKFQLNQYEKEIEEQLVTEIIDDILIYLTKV
tara:strand:+ start:235 stop:666 length:432 start_codon:yes stop_codon:yes gene_type:complete